MRLHSAKLPQVASEMVSALMAQKAIESEQPREVELDVQSVLAQYVRDEQDVADRARDLATARGLPPGELGRLKRLAADERGIKVGDEAIDYLLDQLVEILMHSTHVDEVFAEDVDLRRIMRTPLRKQATEEENLINEVRGRLKHVQEGTSLWEVEYRRMMDDVRRRKGL
ncbi:DUF507 family protein [Myxococcota bacterium]